MVRPRWCLSFILIFGVMPFASALEYVTPEQTKELSADFSKAGAPGGKLLNLIADKDLKCDMYGVRSRLQVERDVTLYRFRPEKALWKNVGAQVVQDYQWVKKELIGTQGILIDKIRILNGRLISELSVQAEAATPGAIPTVLAYSVCKIEEKKPQ